MPAQANADFSGSASLFSSKATCTIQVILSDELVELIISTLPCPIMGGGIQLSQHGVVSLRYFTGTSCLTLGNVRTSGTSLVPRTPFKGVL